MADQSEIKRIERRARSLMLNKEIPPGKMEAVRSLINNRRISNFEKYQTIIDIIKDCPEKKIREVKEKAAAGNVRKTRNKETGNPGTTINYQPTETSYYIDELNKKYKFLKIFKKRYLVHRNNRFGIGLRKRLIPAQKLLTVLAFIAKLQNEITDRLSDIIMDILKDESVQDPLIFNYLRILRKWLIETPLVKYNFDTVKWMERNNFEKEFGSYISYFFSFGKMDIQLRENIIEEIEKRLRNFEDLQKEEITESDSDQIRRNKEKRNLAREKEIYEYMSNVRSFLPHQLNNEGKLSDRLKRQFNINSFHELLVHISVTLIFQRPVTINEISLFFNIKAPVVSSTLWDYSNDFLKKIGKDPDSRRKREIALLREKLEPYEKLVKFLRKEDNGMDLIRKGIENQWNTIENKKHNPDIVYNEDFFSYIDGIVQYFKNACMPFLDGSIIYFKDPDRNEYESSIFSAEYFREDFVRLDSIIDEMHFFKSNNPTLAISRNEVEKIMRKKIRSMSHVEEFVRVVGDFFYNIGKELLYIYELHRLWIFNRNTQNNLMDIRIPLEKDEVKKIPLQSGRPIPFYDSTIKDFFSGSKLTKNMTGEKIIDHSMNEGIFIYVLAFALQAAQECFNEKLFSELDERKKIMNRLEDIRR